MVSHNLATREFTWLTIYNYVYTESVNSVNKCSGIITISCSQQDMGNFIFTKRLYTIANSSLQLWLHDILFAIYINDLPAAEHLQHYLTLMFAGDTK